MTDRRKTPLDQPVRDRLVTEFDRNFLVEAGAGSGKTYSLATRMAAGIAAGIYTVERMAVVTFTRKAAAELRGRFQLAVEERLRQGPPAQDRQRLEAALSGMERLFAGTIHSFCAHLLRERPVDARIAPGFEELSDIDNLQRQRQAWRDFVAAARAGGFQPMLDLADADIQPKDLDDAFQIVCEHEDVEFDMGAGAPPDPKPVWKAVDRFWHALGALTPPEFCEDTKCKVQLRFAEFDGRLRRARRERLASLAGWLGPWVSVDVTQKWWGEAVGRDKSFGKGAKELVDGFREEVVEPFLREWQAYVHRLSMAVLVEAREFYAGQRRRQNVVNYVDLLRVTAAMLRSGVTVRRALRQKYQFLFIDEFQDTDPIQAEIFLMLAGEEAEKNRNQEAAFDPFTLTLRPGALFVVGDPKQSIYRFRRADIDIYNRVAERIRDTKGEVLALTANFRSLPEVCAVANAVFPPLFANCSLPYSPAFEKLDPIRNGADTAAGPRVAKMTIPDGGKGSKPHEEEARRIAAYIQTEVACGRRKYGDFLVLTRQTTRLGAYAGAFDALQIPVDVSGAGLFCQSEEVQATAALLTALADPLDSVALVGVLRGPLFGLSDPELFQFHQAGGRFELSAPLPDPASLRRLGAQDPVLAAMDRLHAMWRSTRELPLAAAVDRILEDTGWLALAATTPAGARAGHLLQAVDRVRQVVEKGGGLREAADALNEEEKSSESEALPLEPGRRDVVRLMNLHKAKGLEAAVVFLADATHVFDFPVVVRIVRDGSRARGYLKIVRVGDEPWNHKTLGQLAGWQAHEEEESKYRQAEKLRLLYVAGTRPKDVLVVCRSDNPAKNKAWGAFEGYLAGVPELQVPERKLAVETAQAPTLGTRGIQVGQGFSPAEQSAAVSARERRQEAMRQPSWAVTSATADGTRSRERASREAQEPHRALAQVHEERGARHPHEERGATDQGLCDAGVEWGSLIHGLLEQAMRQAGATRADLERLARWLTVETPEIRPFIPEALDLVDAVSKAPFWNEARAGGELHVEVPCAVRLDAGASLAGAAPITIPTVVRGAIDLVYRTADGWRIVDYKTDRDAEDEAALVDRHGPQLTHYKMMWEQVTGATVSSTAIFAVRTLRVVQTAVSRR